MQKFTELFPVWILTASLLALYQPLLFTWFSGNFITVGLAVIMTGMGLTLTFADFKRVLELPRTVMTGVVLQYTVMPLSAYLFAGVFALPAPLAAGLILTGSCPGGTASNVIAYLGRANVALSVSMTAVSTILSIFLTPALAGGLIGNRVDVNVWGLFFNTLTVVILPIVSGVLLNRYFHKFSRRLQPAAPPVAVIMIVMIVASVIGSGKNSILQAGMALIGSVFLFHSFGFLTGYILGKLISRVEIEARTISIEVGMQNSGLAVVLAQGNFANPLVAIPGAISSLTHSLIGSFLAAVWRKNSDFVQKSEKD